jgi:hypothetical protein
LDFPEIENSALRPSPEAHFKTVPPKSAFRTI